MEIRFLVHLENLLMNNKMKKNTLYCLLVCLILICCKSKVIRLNEFDFKGSNPYSDQSMIAGSLKIEIVDTLSYIRIFNNNVNFSGVIVDAKRHRPVGNVEVLREVQSGFIPITSTNNSGYFEVSYKSEKSNKFLFYIVGCDSLFVIIDNHLLKEKKQVD
jgi:hypothetical protein